MGFCRPSRLISLITLFNPLRKRSQPLSDTSSTPPPPPPPQPQSSKQQLRLPPQQRRRPQRPRIAMIPTVKRNATAFSAPEFAAAFVITKAPVDSALLANFSSNHSIPAPGRQQPRQRRQQRRRRQSHAGIRHASRNAI